MSRPLPWPDRPAHRGIPSDLGAHTGWQHRYEEALPQAAIVDKLLANPISPGAKQMTVEAHEVLVDIQSRLAAG